MSTKYEDQVDDCNVICPYCKYEYQQECEDYSEEPRVEECAECGKKYWLYESFSVDHHTEPDCEVNGEQHKWKAVQLKKELHDFCSVCDKCRGEE